MKIAKNTVVTVHYKLSDAQGTLIEDGQEPMVYLHGGYENTLPKIEEALEGKVSGFDTTIQVEPEDAFGDYDETLVFLEPRSIFPEALEEGMTFDGAALPTGGSPQIPPDRIYTATEIYPEHVVLDGNHPLAGIAIRLALKVESVREASLDEIGQGSLGTGFFRLEPQLSGNSTLH